MTECLIEGCNSKAKSRGLCVACYQTARQSVRTGKTTWADLEKVGLAKPSTRKHNGVSAFAAAFERVKLGPAFPQQPDQPPGVRLENPANGSVIEGAPAAGEIARGPWRNAPTILDPERDAELCKMLHESVMSAEFKPPLPEPSRSAIGDNPWMPPHADVPVQTVPLGKWTPPSANPWEK